MIQDTTTQCSVFEGLAKRPIEAVFDEPGSSSDGGAVLLSAADRRLGLLSEWRFFYEIDEQDRIVVLSQQCTAAPR